MTSTLMRHQFFPNEIRGKFYLSTPKSKSPSPIIFIVYIGGRQIKFHVRAKVYPDHWHHKLQRAFTSPILSKIDNTNNEIANSAIEKILHRFIEFKSYICNIEDCINLDTTLKDLLRGMAKKRSNKLDNIIDVIKRFVVNDTTISDATAKNYLNKGLPALVFYFAYLEKEKHEKVNDFHAFTTEFFTAFSLHIFNNYLQPNGEPYSVSTINSILKYAKSTIVLAARAGGYLTELEISAIKLKQFDNKSSDNHIALRDDEVMKLYRYKCATKSDEIVKDMFLLECTLGHRIADILRIDDRTEEINGNYYISIAPKKTPQKKVEVGIIFDIAKRLLIDKYNCKLPQCTKDVINKNIKRIAREAGIDGVELQSIHYAGESTPTETKKPRYECISTHTGRRTFISLLAARGWTYERISKYTGQTIEMVEHYNKASEKYTDIYKKTAKNAPDNIVKLCNEDIPNLPQTPSPEIISNDNSIDKLIELAKENERSKQNIDKITQALVNTENKIRQVKHSAEIENQILSINCKSEKEKADFLMELMKMGYTYDDYITFMHERSQLEDRIEEADSEHDTLIDD